MLAAIQYNMRGFSVLCNEKKCRKECDVAAHSDDLPTSKERLFVATTTMKEIGKSHGLSRRVEMTEAERHLYTGA